ncbi:MAG: FAD-dependent oxidoreductase [Euryarchaeota archaeon]|nr:FAD-dependent oxidoreductase [Euryarchaeota archaeon]
MELGFVLPSASRESKEVDLAIIGAGPAGLSAGIYAIRAGLSAIIIDKGNAGGLAEDAPFVENYLGFEGIKGEELAKKFKDHARNYVEISERNEVKDIIPEGEKYLIKAESGEYIARAIIFSTGTTHKHLGIPGEKELFGKGVSYCVTCDGYFYKGKKVAVIGGGNSGAIAAIYLKDIGVEPEIFEFMPKYMCEKAYQKMIEDRGIPYHKNVRVTEITGDEKVTGIKYEDRETGEIHEFAADGVFIYVGLVPMSELAKKIGVETNKWGYINVDQKMRTNVPRVYAAGDVTGTAGQIIIAAGQGAVAALSAYEDLMLS